jgi:hypothetical protein
VPLHEFVGFESIEDSREGPPVEIRGFGQLTRGNGFEPFDDTQDRELGARDAEIPLHEIGMNINGSGDPPDGNDHAFFDRQFVWHVGIVVNGSSV